MTKFVFTISMWVVLLDVTPAHAVECKFREDSIDKFTKVRLLATTWNHIFDWWTTSSQAADGHWSAVLEGEQIYLAMKVKDSEPSDRKPTKAGLNKALAIPDGSLLTISLADGSDIDLTATKTVESRTWYTRPYENLNKTGNYIINATTVVQYAMNAAQANALTEQGVNLLTIKLTNMSVNFNVPESSLLDMQQAIRCLK